MPQGEKPSTLLIRNGIVLTMNDRREIFAPGDVWVRGERIEYVGPCRQRESYGEVDKVLEAEGCAVLPGLINAHTHAAMTLVRGYADDMPLMPWLQEKIWPLEMHLTGEDVYWGTLLAAVEMLRAGVTTFNDMYHFYEEGERAALDAGIRACPGGVLLGILPGAERSMQRAIEYVAHRAARRDEGRIHVMLAPHAPYTCPDSMLLRMAEAARKFRVPIHIHLSETREEVERSLREHGRRPVGHLLELGVLDVPVTAAHCVHLTDEEIRLLKEKDVGVVHNPTSNLKLAVGFARIPDLLRAGVKVGLGTDGAASNNNLDLWEEMRLAALLHKGVSGDPTVLPAEQALWMATRGGAAVLRLEHLIGSLEVGKRADIIVVDLHRPHLTPGYHVVSDLVYSARADDVRTVIVNGTLVLEDRRFLWLDEGKVLQEARRCVEALFQRAGLPRPALDP